MASKYGMGDDGNEIPEDNSSQTFDLNKLIGISPGSTSPWNNADSPKNAEIQKMVDPDSGGIGDLIKGIFTDKKTGNLDLRTIGALGGALAGGLGAFSPNIQKAGYQGGIPRYTANRNMVTAPPAGSRPGAGGVNYGGDVNYMVSGKPTGAYTPPSGGGSSTLGNIAKVAGGAGLAALLGNYLSKSGGASAGLDAMLKAIKTPSSSGNAPVVNQGSNTRGGGDLTTPAGEYAGGDEFSGIDEQIRANENALQEPPLLTNEEIDAEFDRLREEYPIEEPDYEFAKGGGVPRYLQGETDGMADEIPAKIGQKQPAALSHGEFVIPADVVSHLGNGNSDAGAKKLYSMMDKIREARTGTKKQGKRINPDKFMPGGLAQAYANGGHVRRFADGGATGVGSAAAAGVTGMEQAPASWAGEYITDMLGKGRALAEAPYQQYGGPLSAGASDLQNKAFQAAGNLSVPGSVGTAAQTAGDIASKAQGISYSPTGAPQYDKLSAQNVSSTFQAPEAYKTGTFENQFKAPEISAATQFTNQFKAPDAYKATDFKSGTFGQEQAQQYMNPYLQASLNPQLEEARRQSQITEQQNKAAMTRAGAFGGGRGAILAAENQRNLGSNLAGITGKGYDTAFQNAMSQFNQDQARNMQAQQASEQSRQFGAGQAMTAADMQAKYGMSAQQAQEAARQFNQGQSMSAAQMQAQYGLSADQAREASRQFGANQALQAATTSGAQGLQASIANQQAGLTAGQGNINAAMEAARQQEQSRQFGANLGLQGLQTGLQAAQAQGNLGIAGGQLGLQQLQQQAALGAQQRGIEAEGIAADKAAFEQARDNPYKMVQFQQSLLNGLPITATNYNMAQPSTLQEILAGAGGGAKLAGNTDSGITLDSLLGKLGLGSSSPK